MGWLPVEGGGEEDSLWLLEVRRTALYGLQGMSACVPIPPRVDRGVDVAISPCRAQAGREKAHGSPVPSGQRGLEAPGWAGGDGELYSGPEVWKRIKVPPTPTSYVHIKIKLLLNHKIIE